MKVDPDRVDGYAKTVEQAVEDLGGVAEEIGTPLGAEAFGDVGRTVGTTESYSRASSVLREQLGRAVESLSSVADNLHKVVEHHRGADEDSADQIKRSDRR